MIVWSTIESCCPMCQRRLRVRELGGGVALGQDTDLLVRMREKHVIQAEIHTCQKCRFSGYARDFTTRRVPGSTVKRFFEEYAHLLRDHYSSGYLIPDPAASASLPPQTPLPHLQYYWAAIVTPLLGLSPTEAGLRLLRAYWCLRLQPSLRLPTPTLAKLRKLYLREAISRFRQGLRHEKNRVFVYLIGELCRRNGNFLLAAHYFERFLEREVGPRYLKRAAKALLVAAKGSDSSEKTLEEVLYGEKGSSKRVRKQRDPGAADRGE